MTVNGRVTVRLGKGYKVVVCPIIYSESRSHTEKMN